MAAISCFGCRIWGCRQLDLRSFLVENVGSAIEMFNEAFFSTGMRRGAYWCGGGKGLLGGGVWLKFLAEWKRGVVRCLGSETCLRKEPAA